MEIQDDEARAGLILIGSTLGPFYLHDPQVEGDRIAPGLEAIRSLDVAAAADEWPFVAADVARVALEKMKAGLADGIDTDELIWEYRRLFVGPAAKPAPPWGSVYTDKDMVVFGGSTMALREWMRKQGIALTKGESDEPEDHIGTMLELLAWLAQERPELVEQYLTDHLLTWSSHFLEQLETAADHPFYEGLAKLTRASLEGMQDAFSLTVEYPRFYR